MPRLGKIEWRTDRNTFLKADEISDLVDSMDDRGLNEIESNFANPIHDEMSRGLSLEALNIDGRAPLNELSQELSKKIQNSIIDMEGIKKTAQGEGNKHRQDEANEYYKKVIEEYEKKLNLVEEARKNYQDKRVYVKEEKDKKIPDGKGGTKTYTYQKQYADCVIKIDKNGKEYGKVAIINIEESDENDIDPGVEVHDALVAAVKDSVNDANKFYDDYVEPAIKLKNECDKLDTYVNYEYSNGTTREISTNSDGSKVTIDKDADGNIIFQRTEDENGIVTETIWYDKNGNVIEKYEYTIEEVKEGVYKSTPTHFIQDENGTLVQEQGNGTGKGTMYYWHDEEGILVGGALNPSFGVQEGAKLLESEGGKLSDGKGTLEVYENTDGTKVFVNKDLDGKMTSQSMRDEHDNTIETRIYDKYGNVLEKTENEIEEVQEGVYKSTPTHYVRDEHGALVIDKVKTVNYIWYDENGIRVFSTHEPDASQVGHPKTDQTADGTNQKSESGGE